MTVSIIIPHYSRVEKLYQQLNVYKNWEKWNYLYEFIVVDNNSLTRRQKDKITKDFPWLKLITLDVNLGPSGSRNIGLRESNGNFIQFIDDDDLIDHEKIETQLSFLIKNIEIDIVIGGTHSCEWDVHELPKSDSSKITFPDFEKVDFCGQLLRDRGFFQIGSALFRKDTLLAVGGFDEKRWYVEDVDLYLRLYNNKAKFKVNRSLKGAFFWRIKDKRSLSQKNSILLLEGRLLNYMFCIEKQLLKFNQDFKIVYTGIYGILKQNISLPNKLNNLAFKNLKHLNFRNRLKYLPKESFLSFFIGFSGLFKLIYFYRQIKK